jgi:hypothetical protein
LSGLSCPYEWQMIDWKLQHEALIIGESITIESRE